MEELVIQRISFLSGIHESDINMDSSFKDNLNFDSLDFAELCIDLEEKLDTKIGIDSLNNTLTVGELVTSIIKKNK